jgi:hypothetical protein
MEVTAKKEPKKEHPSALEIGFLLFDAFFAVTQISLP